MRRTLQSNVVVKESQARVAVLKRLVVEAPAVMHGEAA